MEEMGHSGKEKIQNVDGEKEGMGNKVGREYI
jgi:hypothetical protein